VLKGQHVNKTHKIAAGAIDQAAANRIRDAHLENERREHDRHLTIFRIAKLTAGDDESICVARNISSGGMMIEVLVPHDLGQKVRVSFAADRHLDGQVIWQEDQTIGVRFESEIDVMDVLAKSPVMPSGCVRRMPRMPVRAHARLQARSKAAPIELCDISPRGAKIKVAHSFEEHEFVQLLIKGLEPTWGSLRWQLAGHAGIEFASVIPIPRLMQWLRGNVAAIAPDK
jgi:hypothetical protein